MPKFGWPEGHGEKRREEIRKFRREEAGTLAKTRMAEVEREQTGLTRRTGMAQAGEMARAKLGGAKDGFTSSQMANLRKSAYDAADKEIERRRGLMAGEPGSFFMGKGKTQTPWAEDQITGERESIASKYLQGYMGGQQQIAPEETQGYGFLTTAGGDRYDVAGSKITKSRIPGAGNVSPARAALTATNLSAEPTGTMATTKTIEKYPTKLEQMTRTPQQGIADAKKMANRLGLGAEEWEATWKLYKDMGGFALEGYKKFIEKLLAGQKESIQRMGQAM